MLARSPAFAATIDAVDELVVPRLGWRVRDELSVSEEDSRLDEIIVLQVTLFAVEVGLAALWGERGLRVDAVAGTSLGEVAAAHVCGALDLPDAIEVVLARSELLVAHRPEGGTIVVNVDGADAGLLLADAAGPVYIAGYNGPGTTTVSGSEAGLVDVLQRAEALGVFAARVRVQYPAHSPLLDPVGPDLRRRLRGIVPRDTSVPFYSASSDDPGRGDAVTAE